MEFTTKLDYPINEEGFTQIVNYVINRLPNRLMAGLNTMDRDDLKQEAWCIALKAMEKYDPVMPLEGFLFTTLYNRMQNLHRDTKRRSCDDSHTLRLGDREDIESGFDPIVIAERAELTELLNEIVPGCDRSIYLRMLENATYKQWERQRIKDYIKEALENYGYLN